MIEVSLFKTKNKSQLEERLKLIKQLCVNWESILGNKDDPLGDDLLEILEKDFSTIYSAIRNIELTDLPLVYDPASQDWEHIDRMEREVAPSVGDTIVIECGDTVEVLHVSHQWDNPELVQVMTREVPQK